MSLFNHLTVNDQFTGFVAVKKSVIAEAKNGLPGECN